MKNLPDYRLVFKGSRWVIQQLGFSRINKFSLKPIDVVWTTILEFPEDQRKEAEVAFNEYMKGSN